METTASALADLYEILRSPADISDRKICVGFDGFVDKIKKAVKEKRGTQTIYFKSIPEIAERILMASGKSGQIQMDIQRIKLGGNAPILANTLGQLGVKTYCIGSMGFPQRHEVFSGMHASCEVVSVLNPGLSDAIEFLDGKLIFSELEVFEKYTWQYLKDTAGIDRLVKAVSDSSLIAFVDWANLPHASDIWKGMLADVVKPSGRKDFYFLFDLCDPSKKTTEEIKEVLNIMTAFSAYGKVTLGLNENETLKIWAALNGIDFITGKDRLASVVQAGDFLYKAMNIDSLLVHPIDRCILYTQHETIELHGRLVEKPKVLTGGGDNLNAGYSLGLISGLTQPQCMLLGMATSGSYIENGSSPGINDILTYMNIWMEDLKKKEPIRVKHEFTHRHQ